MSRTSNNSTNSYCPIPSFTHSDTIVRNITLSLAIRNSSLLYALHTWIYALRTPLFAHYHSLYAPHCTVHILLNFPSLFTIQGILLPIINFPPLHTLQSTQHGIHPTLYAIHPFAIRTPKNPPRSYETIPRYTHSIAVYAQLTPFLPLFVLQSSFYALHNSI